MIYFVEMVFLLAMAGPAHAGAQPFVTVDGEQMELHHDLLQQNGIHSAHILKLAQKMGVFRSYTDAARYYLRESAVHVLATKAHILLAPAQLPFVTRVSPPTKAQNGTSQLKLLYLRIPAMQELQGLLRNDVWPRAYEACNNTFDNVAQGPLDDAIEFFHHSPGEPKIDPGASAPLAASRLVDLLPGDQGLLVFSKAGDVFYHVATIDSVSEDHIVAVAQRGERWIYNRITGESTQGGTWRLKPMPPGARAMRRPAGPAHNALNVAEVK